MQRFDRLAFVSHCLHLCEKIMRLNLGCGSKKITGWINVDKIPGGAVDQVADLEALPWSWGDDSVDEVLMSHVLEHLGATTDVYLGIIKELYRVCRDGAKITIIAPHPRHDHFLGDPTHVRPIMPEALLKFSQAANRQAIAAGLANTPLGLYMGVDFAIESINFVFDEPWRGRLERRELSNADLDHAARTYNNVIMHFQLIMRAVKPPGRTTSRLGLHTNSKPLGER